jgi:hypothetical protein
MQEHRPNWLRPPPRALVIPEVMTLATLAERACPGRTPLAAALPREGDVAVRCKGNEGGGAR